MESRDGRGMVVTEVNIMGISKGSATWEGGFKTGKGTMKPAHAPEATFSVGSRFEGQPSSNPEELIGAALAGCFSMAFSGELGKAGFTPTRITTTATVTLEPVDGKQTVSASHLEMSAVIPGIDAARFIELANGAKAGCPISRLLHATITLDAKLES